MMLKREIDRLVFLFKKLILLLIFSPSLYSTHQATSKKLAKKGEYFLKSIDKKGELRTQLEVALANLEDSLDEESIDRDKLLRCNQELRIAYLINIDDVYNRLREEMGQDKTKEGQRIYKNFEIQFQKIHHELDDLIYKRLCQAPFDRLKQKVEEMHYTGFESVEELILNSKEIRLIHNYFTLFAYANEKRAWVTALCKMLPKRWIEKMTSDSLACCDEGCPSTRRARLKSVASKFKKESSKRCVKYETLIDQILKRDGVFEYLKEHFADVGFPKMREKIKRALAKKDEKVSKKIGRIDTKTSASDLPKTDIEFVIGSLVYLSTCFLLCDGALSEVEEEESDE